MISRYTQQYDFLGYAAEHWPAHYRECEAREEIDMLRDAVELYNPQLPWFSLYWHTTGIYCPLNLSPWILASYLGHLSMLRFFVLQYPGLFDINERGPSGRTPLYFAVDRGHVEIARFLMDNGAVISLDIEYSGETVLHLAAKRGDTKILEIMLKTDVDPDTPAENGGSTALENAAGHGHEEPVRLLLFHGAAADCDALIAAVLCESEGCVRALLFNGETDGFNVFGETALHAAVSEVASEKMARILLENGADPNAQDSCPPGSECCLSQTPLHLAAQDGLVALSELLLVRGADVTLKNKRGQTPLDVAESGGHHELVRIMARPA